MCRLLLTAAAERDIRSALGFSTHRWGAAQAAAYRRLIAEAFKAPFDDPLRPASRARDEVRPGVRTLHIGRPGRPARHLVVYRVAPVGDLEIVRVLHDAMDLRRHLEGDTPIERSAAPVEPDGIGDQRFQEVRVEADGSRELADR